jgi:hypothetical protein
VTAAPAAADPFSAPAAGGGTLQLYSAPSDTIAPADSAPVEEEESK